MNQQNTMRMLTRIRLINWHYFSNETISVKGSFLLSGDNSSGKSTIMDAIQMVLTTSVRNFNQAANDKSKRNLKGYVRGKTGIEGQSYRIAANKSTISYVALEFYEQSKNRYFVLGAKMDSPNEDAEVRKRWFCEEGSLDDLTFIEDGKPATDEQFKNNGKKVALIRETYEAKDKFQRRMGNLGRGFSELIPKSIAFKPMDNIKQFITQYILPEEPISVESLRENIRNYNEMQQLVDMTRRQVEQLQGIIEMDEQIHKTLRDHKRIELLLAYADCEDKQIQIRDFAQKIDALNQQVGNYEAEISTRKQFLQAERENLVGIQTEIATNGNGHLISNLEKDIANLKNSKEQYGRTLEILKSQLQQAKKVQKLLEEQSSEVMLEGVLRCKSVEELGPFEKAINALKQQMIMQRDGYYRKLSELENLLIKLKEELRQLQQDISKLEKNQFPYPKTTKQLRSKIQEEFEKRNIDAPVSVFAELLELKDPIWQNAVEGYLNTQRFNLIVPPEYYDIAAQVYDQNKEKIHSVALVNTQALDYKITPQKNTLADVVVSPNRYATAYACYLMNRVICCHKVEELKSYPIAITAECMLYQGKALRKINPEQYREPYIGSAALKKQLELKKEQFASGTNRLQAVGMEIQSTTEKLDIINRCNIDSLQEKLTVPVRYHQTDYALGEKVAELKQAQSNPTYMEMQMKREQCEKQIRVLETGIEGVERRKNDARYSIETAKGLLAENRQKLQFAENQIELIEGGDIALQQDAKKLYLDNRKSKAPRTIAENYRPRLKTLENESERQRAQLCERQVKYKQCELGIGLDVMQGYYDEYNKLIKQDLEEYSTRLQTAQATCEEEFKETFLAQMQEKIKRAQDLFKELNKTLKSIYYGEDSYQFKFAPNPQKKNLYDMMVSDINIGGNNLFSQVYQNDFHSEMEELFQKLTISDNGGQDIMREYSDYRNYLDYDIEIRSRSGNRQLFSKIYGEKSGGETQTPYYVAMAASFAQVYNSRDSVRLIMLDEAFDKMDDGRIESMMNLFRSMNLQVILAAPSAKIEIIGPHVDSVLVAYREGYESVVEEHDL